MNFYKIKHVRIFMDGTTVCQCGGCEVIKTADGWLNQSGDKMTPLFDSITNELVGFFNAEVINVTFEED